MTEQPQRDQTERVKTWLKDFGENVLIGAAFWACVGVVKTMREIAQMVGEKVQGPKEPRG